ncbi:EF-hand domain-containing protein [Marinimicrococcus flavescens]|uniref:EF-hand domain-containing protein n=1 Tax=Marinimicrococcus flavescens TaxID=3031815 RepID=A0AAP3XPV4_9PROT|nr:EF-hand domain-containing protein [Marinimicrococcus flavescens]
MRRNSLIAVLALALAAGAAGMALAQDGGKERGRGMMDRIDANKDGVIERSEVDAHRQAAFKELDKDGNGSLSFDEFNARADRMFERMDRDGDGKITKEEMPRRHGRGGDKG